MVKQCSKCGKIKSIDNFHKRIFRSGNEGYRSWCIECERKIIASYKPHKPIITKVCINCGKSFETNLPNKKACNVKCLPVNTEYRKDQQYLKEHPEINRKEYFKEKNKKKFDNPEYRKQLMSDPERKARYKNRAKKHRDQHRYEYILRRRAYIKKRMANDVDYKLKRSLRNRITQSINGNKLYNHSIDLLGCSIIEARRHIENQFKDGMSWDNWGVFGWHIDHIIPIASFDFTKKEDQYKCWHYTNLQPLWWLDNVMKADKIIEKQLVLF